MVGGTLLIIYEADWACAEEGGVKKYLEGGDEAAEMQKVGDDERDDEGKEVMRMMMNLTTKFAPNPHSFVKLIDFTLIIPDKGLF
jgi:1D-myo-inositol-tetrakisphosphate 5-kinase/inositol-polyphosphate multikinase